MTNSDLTPGSEPSSTGGNVHFEPLDNRIVWVLAFGPLIGAGIEHSLFGFDFFLATIVLNVGLSWMDLNRLEHTAIDTSRLRAWMMLLVPVYLFRREQLTATRGYFVTWMACFVLSFYVESAWNLGTAMHRDQAPENHSERSQAESIPVPMLAEESPKPVNQSSANSGSDSKPVDETQLLDAQLASLKMQLNAAGQKCISTHDADACDEVEVLKHNVTTYWNHQSTNRLSCRQWLNLRKNKRRLMQARREGREERQKHFKSIN